MSKFLTIEQIRSIAEEVARHYGVERIALVGSYAHGEQNENLCYQKRQNQGTLSILWCCMNNRDLSLVGKSYSMQMRSLQQFGELVGHLSDELKCEYNAMPWKDIKAMRNIAAHNYGEIDPEILWETITTDVPDLKCYCQRTLGECTGVK